MKHCVTWRQYRSHTSLFRKQTIKYKDSSQFKYTEQSQVKDDILKPIPTYLPFQSAISLKLSILVKTKLSLDQQNMINKYDEAMKNIISKNTELSILNYICNDFVLENPHLNQLKNKLLIPDIIYVSESQQKLIEKQKTLLEKMFIYFTRTKQSKLIHLKLDTEQIKLEGELFEIKKFLEKLKSSQSARHEGARLLLFHIKNINTDIVDDALVNFQKHQKSLYDNFRSKNDLGTQT